MREYSLRIRRKDIEIDVEDFRSEMRSLLLIRLEKWRENRELSANENTKRLMKIYEICLKLGKSLHGYRLRGKRFHEYPELTLVAFERQMDALIEARLCSDMNFAFTLPLGEGYEKAFCTAAKRVGKTAYRPDNSEIAKMEDIRAYQQHQRDVCMMLSDGSEINVEIKCLTTPFKYPNVLVGSVGKWDNKMFSVFAVMIIDSESLEMRWAYADAEAQKEWLREDKGYGLSYSVPISKLMPIDALVPYLL